MKIGRYTKLADGLRTTPVPLVQLAQATPLDASGPFDDWSRRPAFTGAKSLGTLQYESST